MSNDKTASAMGRIGALRVWISAMDALRPIGSIRTKLLARLRAISNELGEERSLDTLESDLYGVVGNSALAAGVTVTEGQALAIAHAVMRYMGAFSSDEAPAVRGIKRATPPTPSPEQDT